MHMNTRCKNQADPVDKSGIHETQLKDLAFEGGFCANDQSGEK